MASIVNPLLNDCCANIQSLRPQSSVGNQALDAAASDNGGLQHPWIALDGRGLMLEQGTGLSRYSEALTRALNRLPFRQEVLLDRAPGPNGVIPSYGKSKRGLQRARRWLRALSNKRRAADIIAAPADAAGFDRIRRSSDVFRLAQVHFDVYRKPLWISNATPPAIMHWTYPLPIRFERALNIYTIHDIIPLLTPSLTSISESRHRKLLQSLLATADHIVTVSETSRRAIVDWFDYPEDKITNTYEGIAFEPREVGDTERVAQYGLRSGDYFVAVGTIERRKNVGRLITAYLASGAKYPLVLVGPNGWKAASELAPAEGHIINVHQAAQGMPGVLPLGFVPRATARALLQGARSLLFPSRAEGFGLPIIEAMAVGTPVMTSRGGATEEVAGDAALMIDPLNISDMAAAITALATKPELRAALAERGFARAANFSNERYAERLEALYRRLISAKSNPKTVGPHTTLDEWSAVRAATVRQGAVSEFQPAEYPLAARTTVGF